MDFVLKHSKVGQKIIKKAGAMCSSLSLSVVTVSDQLNSCNTYQIRPDAVLFQSDVLLPF